MGNARILDSFFPGFKVVWLAGEKGPELLGEEGGRGGGVWGLWRGEGGRGLARGDPPPQEKAIAIALPCNKKS